MEKLRPLPWRRGRIPGRAPPAVRRGEVVHLDADGPGFDFGQFEDAVEEFEEVVARGADDACVLDLGVGHVVFGVVFELLGEDEQAVEGGAEFVGHVGDELGFVAGGHGELADLFLDEAFGAFDFLVFVFGFDVLGG